MYTTTVKVRKILNGKVIAKIIIPLIIWIILIIISLGMKNALFVFPVMVIIFFSIIPICIYIHKITDEFRGEKSFITKQVTFKTINGELYVENIKMNVKQNKSKTKIYVEDIRRLKTKSGRNTNTYYTTFIGTIEEPYLKDFIKFLDEKGVKIQK